MRRLAAYFKPYWLILIGVLVLMIANAWTQVLTPELTGQAVDCYLTPAVTSQAAAAANAADAADGDPAAPVAPNTAAASANCWFGNVPAGAPIGAYMAGLTRLVLGLVGVYVLGALTGGLMFFSMGWTGQHVLRRLQVEVFDHLHELSLGYYSKHESGDLMSRITNDTSTIQQALGFALVNVLSGGLLVVWIAWTMLAINWAYALLSLTVVPLMAIATVWFSGQARKAFRRTRKEIGNVNAELEESISGVREAQAFSREDANIENFRQSNAANRDANVRAVAYTSALAPTLEGAGLRRHRHRGRRRRRPHAARPDPRRHRRLPGPDHHLYRLCPALQPAHRPDRHPVDQHPERHRRRRAHLRHPRRDARHPGALRRPAHARDPGPCRLQPRARPNTRRASRCCKDINLEAEPGQTIAIVGPTGAGKTTLVNLLPRFYDVTGGAVTIDGVDVRTVTLASLRRQIGVVLQDTFLFSDTVMNNIRYGRPEASDEEVIAAAKLARADEFIEQAHRTATRRCWANAAPA